MREDASSSSLPLLLLLTGPLGRAALSVGCSVLHLPPAAHCVGLCLPVPQALNLLRHSVGAVGRALGLPLVSVRRIFFAPTVSVCSYLFLFHSPGRWAVCPQCQFVPSAGRAPSGSFVTHKALSGSRVAVQAVSTQEGQQPLVMKALVASWAAQVGQGR